MMPAATYSDRDQRRELAASFEADGQWFAAVADQPKGLPDDALLKGVLWYLIYRVTHSLDHPKPQGVHAWMAEVNDEWHNANTAEAQRMCRMLVRGADQVIALCSDIAPERCEALYSMAGTLTDLVSNE